jgi:tetratricopeptide (TPR) repeat protein
MIYTRFAIATAIVFMIGAQTAAPQSATPTPKLAVTLADSLNKQNSGDEVPRERREQAYQKLMEGQRMIWRGDPMRAPISGAASMRSAKSAFQRAVELDPNLSEGYTALAEISLNTPPNDVDEAIALARLGTRVDKDNFGAHRILARLYTYKSHLNTGIIDQNMAAKAVSEWKDVARLDPRNAEAWAFLSEFYFYSGKESERIDALQKWVASPSPLETQFYRRIMGGSENLTPERASLKLGTALIKAGRPKDAVEVLGLLVTDEPENAEAVDTLREAVESGGEEAGALAVSSLQQAVYSNPGNSALVSLLAQIHARAGRTDLAARDIDDALKRLPAGNKAAGSALHVALGDIYASVDNVKDSISAYDSALAVRGLKPGSPVPDADHDFAIDVFEKMIQVYKNADRPADVKLVIERARQLFGKNDLFADKQLVSVYRETGNKAAALETVRQMRARFPDDHGLVRLEASILTESGKVDDGVALIRELIARKYAVAGTSAGGSGSGETIVLTPSVYDEFSNLLFVSQLYSQANRGKQAIASANEALVAARGEERRQIAKLALATAQQLSGDYTSAEATLREVLKQSPRNPMALNNLGYFLLESETRLNEAFELIQKAARIDPTNPSYLDSLGWANFKLGRLAEAEKSIRAAARLDPASETIYEHLGDVYKRQGKTEMARQAWQRALVRASDAADIARLKGKLK